MMPTRIYFCFDVIFARFVGLEKTPKNQYTVSNLQISTGSYRVDGLAAGKVESCGRKDKTLLPKPITLLAVKPYHLSIGVSVKSVICGLNCIFISDERLVCRANFG